MALPKLITKKDQVNVTNAFLGLNKGLHISDTEFSEMQNMTNDFYPCYLLEKSVVSFKTFIIQWV